MSDDVYGGTYRLFARVFDRLGIALTVVDMRDASNVKKALRKKTKLVWIETPTNPMLKVVDIAAIADIARKAEGALGRRQHVREPVPAEPARARHRSRAALDDEVHRRPLRRRGRRDRRKRRSAAGEIGFLAERQRRRARSLGLVARAPRREDARGADGASLGERTGRRRVARRASEGEERELPGPRHAPAARARAAADAELRRDAELRAGRRRGRRETRRRAHQDLRARGVARRRRVAHRDPARDDPRLGARHEARAARRPGPALGRHRDRVDDLIADLAHAIA